MNDVDRFMDNINAVINLRLESDRRSRSIYTLWRTHQDRIVAGAKLRKESDKMLKEAESMLYDLIDNALDDEVVRLKARREYNFTRKGIEQLQADVITFLDEFDEIPQGLVDAICQTIINYYNKHRRTVRWRSH